MTQVVIENPIINSPFEEPRRHFRFNDDGITDEVAAGRRVSSYFVPIAQPRKKGGRQASLFETEWTQDRIEENALVNDIRRAPPGARHAILALDASAACFARDDE